MPRATAFTHPIPGSSIGFGPISSLEHGTLQPFSSVFVGVQLDVMDVARGLKSLSMAYEAIPSWVVAKGAEKLQSDIRFYTPVGPERSLEPTSVASQAGANLADVFTGYEQAWNSVHASALNKIVLDLKHQGIERPTAGQALSRMRSVFDPSAPRPMSFSPEQIVSGGLNEFSLASGDVVPIAKNTNLTGQGSLWNSISVNTKGQRGVGVMVAYSSNYYAWFVENGFLSTYMPVPYIPDGGYTVNVAQLGKYPYFLGMLLARQERKAASSSSKGKDVYSMEDEVGGFATSAEMIGFVRRKNPKWIPGAHMFEKGFNDFAVREGLIAQSQMSDVTMKIWEERMSAGTAVAKVFQRRDLGGQFTGGKEVRRVEVG